jgi:hypothetical protein
LSTEDQRSGFAEGGFDERARRALQDFPRWRPNLPSEKKPKMPADLLPAQKRAGKSVRKKVRFRRRFFGKNGVASGVFNWNHAKIPGEMFVVV